MALSPLSPPSVQEPPPATNSRRRGPGPQPDGSRTASTSHGSQSAPPVLGSVTAALWPVLIPPTGSKHAVTRRPRDGAPMTNCRDRRPGVPGSLKSRQSNRHDYTQFSSKTPSLPVGERWERPAPGSVFCCVILPARQAAGPLFPVERSLSLGGRWRRRRPLCKHVPLTETTNTANTVPAAAERAGLASHRRARVRPWFESR